MAERLLSVSSASFHKPAAVLRSAWRRHAPFAFWIIEAHRPRTLVELGTHFGFSFLCFCQQVRAMNLAISCTAVDTWTGDEHAGHYDDRVYQQLKAYQQAHYPDIAHLLRMTFDEALDLIPDGSVDLLHIDGRHFYEDVRHDYEAWRCKLSDRAIVLFHDTQVRDRSFGVWKLWSELEDLYPSFEFEHGHGLGVLGVGNSADVIDLPLFRDGATRDGTQRIRHAYETLGDLVETGGVLRRNDDCPCGSGDKYKHCHGKLA